MVIKKFIGKTEEEATAAARAELGDSLVILSVRTAPKKGLLGLFRKKQIEVTAAKEVETARGGVQNDNDIKETLRAVAKVAEAAEQKNAQASQPEQPKNNEEKSSAPMKEEKTSPASVSGGKDDLLAEKLDNLQTMLSRKLEPEEEEKRTEKPVQEKQASEMDKFLLLLKDTMLDNEIDPRYVDQIIDEMEKSNKPGIPFDAALTNIYQRMILKFGKPAHIEPASKGPKILFFIGPTGVGKTTTIAKLASKLALTDKKEVALLTTDTYRIAATEQLQTYANILQVPFRVIYSTDDIDTYFPLLRGKDYILVDTAGHSQQNEELMDNMQKFLKAFREKGETDVYLVLSATTKYRDLKNIADNYKKMTEFSLIFTKLDETSACGNLLNMRLYTGAELSYTTYGQNVPDDIEQFNPQKTVKVLLGGKN